VEPAVVAVTKKSMERHLKNGYCWFEKINECGRIKTKVIVKMGRGEGVSDVTYILLCTRALIETVL
jgi:hypothetical protein